MSKQKLTKEEKAALKAQDQQLYAEWKAEQKEQKALRKARMKARPLWVKLLSVLARVAAV